MLMDNRFYKPAQPPRRDKSSLLVLLRPKFAARPTLRRTPLAAALMACCASQALAQPAPPASAASAPALQISPRLTPRKADDVPLPVTVLADEIRGRPDLETVAEGNVELRRGSVVLRADRVSYEHADDLAHARGRVRIEANGNLFTGPELQLHLQRFEGFFLQPEYFIARTGAGGSAQRIDFIDSKRAQVIGATYTSCGRDGSGAPAWVLSAARVKMDFEANEGVAERAVLRFYGVPLLAAPVLSFPLTEERKSGWLPPTVNIDNRSGIEFALPYYWNIAPNRDATITPTVLSRRGVGLDTEFRYLERNDRGQVSLNVLPSDRVADRSRHALQFQHEGERLRVHYAANVLRVSDDAYWQDFPRSLPLLTPRLLPHDLQADRRFVLGGEWTAYSRVQHWQVLQAPVTDLIDAPYQRSPQVGVRGAGVLPLGIEYSLETELNRFTRPPNALDLAPRPEGTRWHALGVLSRPFTRPGWWVVPRVAVNAASYTVDGLPHASRVIPTTSVDAGALFERDATWFGRSLRQTLEPRVLYVNTPFRDQSALPNFDAAGKDFNEVSLFSENAFSGIDRVSDAHQLTAGVTTRLIEPANGAELLRLGLAQRVLLRDQRFTPEGEVLSQRFSDLLLLGSSRLGSKWTVDAAVQYSPELNRAKRSVLRARYSPGPFRTVSAGYRLTRGASEQVDVGWQWPVYGPGPGGKPAAGNGGCGGTLYSVGRVNYSMRDSRVTDSLIGFEYDAGCWIARVVGERLSTGRTEATTRLLLQLELVGLSRLGSNPLRVLKDNIPGYRLLRDEPGAAPAPLPVYE
jgi:LPS-assembly protein